MKHSPLKTLAAFAVPALTLLVAACSGDGGGSSDNVTSFQFCANVSYQGKPWGGVSSFYNRYVFTVNGTEYNLSSTLLNKSIPGTGTNSGHYCSPVVQLPTPLPAAFFNLGQRPTAYSWAIAANATCVMSPGGVFTTSNPIQGTGTVTETETYAFDGNGCSGDPSQNSDLQNLPPSLIPLPTPALPVAPTGCVGDTCPGSNVFYRQDSNLTFIGHVTSVDPSGTVSFSEDMAFNQALNMIFANLNSVWWSDTVGTTQVAGWNGSDSKGKGSNGKSEPQQSPTLAADQTPAESSCIGNVCETQTVGMSGGQQALVLNLFGDYFDGVALATLNPGSSSATVTAVPIAQLFPVAGDGPTATTGPSGNPVTPTLQPCAGGTAAAGCYALVAPHASGTDTVSLVVQLNTSSKAGWAVTPVLEVEVAGTGASTVAYNAQVNGTLIAQNWGTLTPLTSSPCSSTVGPDWVDFCNQSLVEPSIYPESACVGSICEGNTYLLQGSSKGPASRVTVFGAFAAQAGDASGGYVLGIQNASNGQTAVWSVADFTQAAVLSGDIGANPAGTQGTACNDSTCQCSGNVCVGDSVLIPQQSTTLYYGEVTVSWMDVGLVSKIHSDGSADVTGELAYDINLPESGDAAGDGGCGANSMLNGFTSYDWKLAGWTGWKHNTCFSDGGQNYATGLLAETPCIENVCEGAQLGSSSGTIVVYNLFGNATNGIALVGLPSGFGQMNIGQLIPLAPTPPTNVLSGGTGAIGATGGTGPSGTAAQTPFQPCAGGSVTTGCYGLVPAFTSGTDTISLVVSFGTASGGAWTVTPVLELDVASGGASTLAYNAAGNTSLTTQKWGTVTHVNASACTGTTGADWVDFCSTSLTEPTVYPENSSIGTFQEGQTYLVQGSSTSPASQAKILGLFAAPSGDPSGGYALLLQTVSGSQTVIWSIAMLTQAVLPSSAIGVSASTGPSVNVGSSVAFGEQASTLGPGDNSSPIASTQIGHVSAVNSDGSVNVASDFELSTAAGSIGWGCASTELSFLSYAWNLVTSTGAGLNQASELGYSCIQSLQTWTSVTTALAETPCIGNVCEGATLSSSSGTVTIYSLFGNASNGIAIVGLTSGITQMTIAQLSPLASTPPTNPITQ